MNVETLLCGTMLENGYLKKQDIYWSFKDSTVT